MKDLKQLNMTKIKFNTFNTLCLAKSIAYKLIQNDKYRNYNEFHT